MDKGMNHDKNTELIAGIAGIAIIITILLSGCVGTENVTDDKTELKNNSGTVNETVTEQKPENITIKVVKFEPDNPCQGCTNLGNYAEETIKTHFPEEYKSGKITYETVNYQDPKNRQIIEKYNVMGSSLYITVIKDGKEEIIDANDMWNYVWDEDKYIDVFKNKLENLKNAG